MRNSKKYTTKYYINFVNTKLPTKIWQIERSFMDTHIKYLKIYARLIYKIYIPMYGDEDFSTILGKHFRDTANDSFVDGSDINISTHTAMVELVPQSSLMEPDSCATYASC